MEVDILGTKYTVEFKNYEDDEAFVKEGIVGYCDRFDQRIICCIMPTHPLFKDAAPHACSESERETLRHEIVHAFLNESGLQSDALEVRGPWAKNEEMVDWFALQGPKIFAAWKEAGCI